MLTEKYTLELAKRTRLILINKDIDTRANRESQTYSNRVGTDRDRYS